MGARLPWVIHGLSKSHCGLLWGMSVGASVNGLSQFWSGTHSTFMGLTRFITSTTQQIESLESCRLLSVIDLTTHLMMKFMQCRNQDYGCLG
jgi:hypothetical protein